MAVINFEIFKVIGTLSEDKDGWNESDLETILAEAIEEKQASKE